jgi:MYXO-CTERM domain-containing protein
VKHRLIRALTLSGLAAACASSLSEPARACGGFFCSQQGLVNQAAERIVFADNGDGTITAVIQIQYQGPADKFSWLLPIGSVPGQDQIAVSSDYAFSALQQATNPNYLLQTSTEGSCRESNVKASAPAPVANSAQQDSAGRGSVTVDATGEVGNFDYAVISVDGNVNDPAAPAVDWLHQNGYDVTPEGVALLGPYLADGMHLLALRLTKGSDSGSIRPIEITYKADAPMIPIKLTAVAANQDMGVLTWALSNARAVPFNYNALELNEARINWFNAASNYNQVVTEAADAAGGQGFVTEYAAPSSQLGRSVWSEDFERSWQEDFGAYLRSGSLTQDQQFQYLEGTYGSWSGFWDAVRKVVTLPPGVSFDDFRSCSACRRQGVSFDPDQLHAALDTDVIEPVRRFQRLIDRTGYTTRLYTTLSASEMIVDPVFRFNPDLPDVSNQHVARRVIECRSDLDQSNAPWRIEFGDGSVLRGGPGSAGQWPGALAAQPANQRVLMLSTSGEGRVVEDNTDQINSSLVEYNARVPRAPDRGGFCSLQSAPEIPRSAGAWSLALLALAGIGWLRRRNPR